MKKYLMRLVNLYRFKMEGLKNKQNEQRNRAEDMKGKIKIINERLDKNKD